MSKPTGKAMLCPEDMQCPHCDGRVYARRFKYYCVKDCRGDGEPVGVVMTDDKGPETPQNRRTEAK